MYVPTDLQASRAEVPGNCNRCGWSSPLRAPFETQSCRRTMEVTYQGYSSQKHLRSEGKRKTLILFRAGHWDGECQVPSPSVPSPLHQLSTNHDAALSGYQTLTAFNARNALPSPGQISSSTCTIHFTQQQLSRACEKQEANPPRGQRQRRAPYLRLGQTSNRNKISREVTQDRK